MVNRLHDVGYGVFLGSAWKEGGDGSEIRQRETELYSIPTQVSAMRGAVGLRRPSEFSLVGWKGSLWSHINQSLVED